MNEMHRYCILAILWLVVSCHSAEKPKTPAPQAPVAKRIPYNTTIHGITLTDDYRWLRDKDNPEVLAYLESENAYTDRMTAHTAMLRQELFRELKGRIAENDRSAPVKMGHYRYYTRTEKGKQYKIYCRKKDLPSGKEEILLNANELAAGKPYFAIGDFEVSPDHQLLAYTTDTTGSENYTLYIKNLQTEKYLPDRIPDLSYSLEWANDNRAVFYTTQDEAHRPCKLFIHKLGTPYQEDMQEYYEEDERFYLSIEKSRNDEYLVMNLESQTTSEVHILPADKPHENFEIFRPREQDVIYRVFPHKDDFFILTNKNAVNYKLMKVPEAARSMAHWEEVIPHKQGTTLENVTVFSGYLAIEKRKEGIRQISICALETGKWHTVQFPDPDYTVYVLENPDFTSLELRFTYSSLVTPATVYDYHMEDHTRKMVKQEKILGGYDPGNYRSERIFATAGDGTKIPISLVYRKGLVKDDRNPLYLYGYGAYGSLTNPYFSPNLISLLDRGFIYAIAHIRGSGDMGEKWYLAGKLFNKKNTFTDFIACAEHLIRENYTDSTLLVAMGRSAGGLLMGTVANMRPELFGGIVAHVPFVDVVNTMLDETLPLTITEYEEWGNPNEKAAFDYMYSYSPYNNVQQQDYPDMLVTAGLNDPRVGFWEPAKWTARLRAMKTDTNRLLLRTNMAAGHGGASGRYNHLKDVAFEYAFVLDVLGLKTGVLPEAAEEKIVAR